MRQRIWTCKGLVVREGRGFSFVKNYWPKSRELGSSKSFFWYVVFRSLNILYDSDVSYLSRGHNTPHLLSGGPATSISIVSVHRDGPTRPTFWGVGWIRPVVSTYSYSSCQCSHLLWQRLQSRGPPFPVDTSLRFKCHLTVPHSSDYFHTLRILPSTGVPFKSTVPVTL